MAFDAEQTTKSRDLLVMEKARERIARGWKPHAARGQSWCAWLAVTIDSEWQGDDLSRWSNALGFDQCGEVMAWNDAPGRTQDEVLAKFDAAIERLSHDV